jgi:hypothetical protein
MGLWAYKPHFYVVIKCLVDNCLLIATQALFQLSGCCLHSPMLSIMALAVRVLLPATPREIQSHLKDRHPHPTEWFKPTYARIIKSLCCCSNHCAVRADQVQTKNVFRHVENGTVLLVNFNYRMINQSSCSSKYQTDHLHHIPKYHINR